MLFMIADQSPEMTLTRRADLYDKASLVLAMSVSGKASVLEVFSELGGRNQMAVWQELLRTATQSAN
jgi:hypothetical protein